MKKINFILPIFIFCIGFEGNAQLSTDKYSIGIYGGINFNKLHFDDDLLSNSSRYKAGWVYGFIYDKFFATNYAFSSGLDVRSQRAEFVYFEETGASGLQPRTVEVNYRYLQVPLSVKVYINEFNFFTPFLRFGGMIGHTYRHQYSVTPEPDNPVTRLDNNFSLSLIFSIGTLYQIGQQTHLIFGFDYNNSLINNVDNDRIQALKGESPRFGWFTLTTGLMF